MAYQWAGSGVGGISMVFAVPADREFPFPTQVEWDEWGRSIKGVPEWADQCLGKYLEGDGSPLSYFEASLFQREARKVGAWGHGSNWGEHLLFIGCDPSEAERKARFAGRVLDLARRLLDLAGRALDFTLCTLGLRGRKISMRPGLVSNGRGLRLAEGWTWLEPTPDDWRPVVYKDEAGSVIVEFYTHSALGLESLYRHRDTYREGYSYSAAQDTIAEGLGGYLH